ncbi:MAG: TetR/AcrR family transcriptional regulator [Anaerolineae bacterium]|nr:TetR/AcrR family transcriptional regulator [Anaerolineae bacterium]MCB9458125.1 TetR/AcrR family transcriptional regulator [Anaerolineaceae bacterium]
MNKDSYHHGDLKHALLVGACEMIATEGIQNMSLRKVARKIGVSHNAPYQHFADKEALLAAVAQEGFQRLTDELDTVIERTSTQSCVEQLKACGNTYIKFMMDNSAYLEVMFGPYPYEDYPELAEAGLESLQRLIAVVARGQASGEIKSLNPVEVAGTVWMSLHGLSTILRNGKLPPQLVSERTPTQLASDFLDVIYEGILVQA